MATKLVEGGWPEGTIVRPTLPGKDYYDVQNYQRELEKIWFRTWLCIGRVEEWKNAGDFITTQVAHENVMSVLTSDGQIKSYYNVCRHKGSRLCEGSSGHFHQGRIFCPYHSWGYNADSGALIRTPNLPDDLEGFCRDDFSLFQVRTETAHGFVFINFDKDTESLEQALGLPESFDIYERYHFQRLRLGHKKSYVVEANWKLIMENALECYHCSTIHPELSRCTPPTIARHWVHDEVPGTKILMHAGAMQLAPGFERMTMDGVGRRPFFPDITEQDRKGIYYFFIFPHLFFAVASDYVFYFSAWPMAGDKTLVVGHWLFEPEVLENPEYDISDAVDFWDITSVEDWKASELVQQGNQSKAYEHGGVLIPNDWRVGKFSDYVRNELAD
ncbi:MAG: aromatic ring-hydroxylating dioxygenase subunit alpha [Alicyclobacillaceae bacterium]|jgi:Rieske 2Fe-2S family protein|uniref:aromatic ring-hydroxylating oxygenase subunit alpha n=1 Tax=Alicyclobacillus sp. SP_1 TaxID=2942475 RepID=UPI0021577685|nr:aromatic ring-hydroxylating dioxygenase subunit alpha [Alicyclobacillus sp. SP_1]MCY0887025.1 aromatic ring-hydroxylating dioxygenase subunit alpha [Alicyclobacillaceae bacterium]